MSIWNGGKTKLMFQAWSGKGYFKKYANPRSQSAKESRRLWRVKLECDKCYELHKQITRQDLKPFLAAPKKTD